MSTDIQAPQLAEQGRSSPSAVVISETSSEILDAFLHLVKLLDNPAHIPILSPMIVREIHFHLLASPLGDCLRMANTIGTQANQIALSVNWLREHYKESLQVEDLAQMVNMAPSTFHRHFQQVTILSPLQFQKHLRLYEAERLMVLEGKMPVLPPLMSVMSQAHSLTGSTNANSVCRRCKT
jgi:AraC-like DNA-binding protein